MAAPQETYKTTVFEGHGEEFWGRTYVGEVRIATDHVGAHGYETMIFNGQLDGEADRYSTEEGARIGHELMVDRVKVLAMKGKT